MSKPKSRPTLAAQPTREAKALIRQKIATALLLERLGLEADWHDPDFPINLPTSLPSNTSRSLTRSDLRDIESGLRRLGSIGCNERVLYWCLGQLTDTAEKERHGDETVIRNAGSEQEEDFQKTSKPHSMPTRQDMLALSNKARNTAKAIKRQERELLLMSRVFADSIEGPSGFFNEPQLPEESIAILLSSLGWIRKLADAWQPPNLRVLTKSKGLLFLLVYVWYCTAFEEANRKRRNRRARKDSSSHRLSPNTALEVAEIVHAYTGKGYKAGDLNDKLQDFVTNEPAVFEPLLDLVKTLNSAVSERPLSRMR